MTTAKKPLADASETNRRQEKGIKNILKNYKKFLVRLWFAMQMAFHGVISNPLRSSLTVLGVAIGVASVVRPDEYR